MRLSVLDHGHSVLTKALFGFIRLVSRQPVLDVVKLVRYRPELYGKPMGAVTQAAMRGPSSWSIGDRELMAAVVAQANACAFCTQAHSSVARRAFGEVTKVASVLADVESASIDDRLRATLRMLQKLAREQTLTAADVRAVLATGVTRPQIEDALAVSFAFNTIARLADAFGFSIPSTEAMDAGAKYLLARGYG